MWAACDFLFGFDVIMIYVKVYASDDQFISRLPHHVIACHMVKSFFARVAVNDGRVQVKSPLVFVDDYPFQEESHQIFNACSRVVVRR